MKKIVRQEYEISRSSYLKEIVSYKDKDLIKVIAGIRRSGKSVIMQQYYELLTTMFKVKHNHIFYVNFDDSDNNELKEHINLTKALKQFISLNKGNKYVLLDEIQEVSNFEEVILNLYQHKEVDIYLTGSNATLNSKQIATKFVGRSVKIEISPFSFTEMIEYNKKSGSSLKTNEELFDEYRKYGGMPVILSLRSDWYQVKELLVGIVGQIIIRDVAPNYKVDNITLFNRILTYVYDTTSQTISLNNISESLSRFYKIKIHTNKIEEYLNIMTDVFLLSKVKRFDVSGKQILKTLDKYYAIDCGIRNAFANKNESNLPWLLETIVYNELKRRRYNVTVGKISKFIINHKTKKTERRDLEIDFIAKKGDEIVYVQVSESIKNPKTFEREITPLSIIKDSHKKIIITNDHVSESTASGIVIVNIIDFLMAE